MREKRIQSLEELEREAGSFLSTLARDSEHATLVTLSGELGAGKTAFTKAIAKVLGVSDTVTSPTFVLEKIYPLRGEVSQFRRLVHIDAYRLESAEDAVPLTLDSLMRDPQNLIVIEWPERIADALPVPQTAIAFVANADGSRTMIYG